jgi:hypothetical protein
VEGVPTPNRDSPFPIRRWSRLGSINHANELLIHCVAALSLANSTFCSAAFLLTSVASDCCEGLRLKMQDAVTLQLRMTLSNNAVERNSAEKQLREVSE